MKYIYKDKPKYDPEKSDLYPDYRIENGIFYAGWKVTPKLDEDGYAPTPDEQPEDAPTLRDRLAALESAMLEMLGVSL